MKNPLAVLALSLALLLIPAGPSRAGLITFETVPGVGTPTETMTIGTQYLASDGVSFMMSNGNLPRISEVGDPLTAFLGVGGIGDNPAVGQNVGRFFLTDDVVGLNTTANLSNLIITYASPVAAASGEIIDIDSNSSGFERWVVEARNSSNVVIASITLTAGDPGTGNGIATPFGFTRATNEIASLVLRYTGTKDTGIGLAFDNFSTNANLAVPEPSSALLVGASMVGLAGWRWRRKRAS